jgi:uncharacterized membrane protein
LTYSNSLLARALTFIRDRLGDLFYGLVFWLPIGIIVLLVSYIYGSLEDSGVKFLDLFLPETWILPGFGLILWILVLILTGAILKNTSIGDYLSRVPVLGVFFRTKGGSVISFKKLAGLTPCLFLFSPTCPSYGWILSEERIRLNEDEADFSLVNVYYPNVPSIVTGQIFPVRKEAVMKIGNPSKEIIDLLLYALRSPESIRYLPWEHEKEDEFRKRAESFGLQPDNHCA